MTLDHNMCDRTVLIAKLFGAECLIMMAKLSVVCSNIIKGLSHGRTDSNATWCKRTVWRKFNLVER